ncbi:MAG: hypothetical protein KIT27_04370 [Legionellales bacterium]|nr:hypothetical protein [Legionellales bacterium]
MSSSGFQSFFNTTAKDMHDIASPLKTHFNTSYLNFVRRFEDGTEACLTTDPEWTNHFYENKLYKQVKIDKVFVENEYLANKIKVIPWTQFHDSPVRQAQSKLFGVGVGISILFIRNGYADFFHFGTKNENQFMNQLYTNYSDCLVQFTHFFYTAADQLIVRACDAQNKIKLNDRGEYRQVISNLEQDTLNISEFVKTTKPKRYLVHGNYKTAYLSHKEIHCIRLASLGMNATQIGKKLFISKRTVETHIKNVREKLELPSGVSKAEIIEELISYGFDIHRLLPSDRLR